MTKNLFLALCFLGFTACAEAADPPCYDMNAVACETFQRTNAERASAGLAELRYCERCFAMAQDQSEDMHSRNYFGHARPATAAGKGETFSQRAARFGLPWVGENIAQTNGGAARAVSNWMGSAGHRRNILNADYTSFAVGYREGLYTQVFAKDPGQGAAEALAIEER